MKMYGVFVGRFSPLHNAHISIINYMIQHFKEENCLVLIGSCNSKLDLKNKQIFTYSQRKEIIRSVFADISIAGLPDFKDVDSDPTYAQWHENMWDIIHLKFPEATKENVVLQSGDPMDIRFFTEREYQAHFHDRHECLISATKVREILMRGLFGKISEEEELNLLMKVCDYSTIPIIRTHFKNNIQNVYPEILCLKQ